MRFLPLFLFFSILSVAACQAPVSETENQTSAEQNTETVNQEQAVEIKPQNHSISAKELPAFLEQNPSVVLLDVRTPEEIARGKLEGALEMDIMNPNFQEQLATLDKTKTYVVYCRSGKRSANACKRMEKEGFNSYYNLEGGIVAYQKNK